MKNKIELFQELFSSDPTSKVFYPLAKLYAESGMLLQAADTLRQGLSRHPDHMEARLLFIDILNQLERSDQAREEVEVLAATLSRYPSFWSIWAARAGESSKDAAVALNFLSAHLAGKRITWADVLLKGFAAISGQFLMDDDLDLAAAPRRAGAPQPAAPVVRTAGAPLAPRDAAPGAGRADGQEFTFEDSEQAPETPSSEAEPTLRTRTMAELLVSQGDFSGALEIFGELASLASGAEKADIERRMAEVRKERAAGPSEAFTEARLDEADFTTAGPMQRAKNKLVRSLSLLAERLEARAGA